MKNDGYAETTIEPIGRRLRNLAEHANLDNPEEVKAFISVQDWKSSYKNNTVNAYNHYALTHEI